MSEILAPCGGADSLTAAVNAGADAVYLGEELFSARKNAANFSYESLCEAVKLCHYSGVKVYVTLNTLVFDKEIPQLIKAVESCAKAQTDGFIIQDLGVAAIARRMVPDMPLHASTQMTINSLAGAIAAKKLGFSRIVLGRELSFEQIKQITEGCDIETEIFVHGALCVCVSGQCYMSAMLGGRSGNRGLCAQPCRLPYKVGDSRSPVDIMSLKDLCTIEHIPDLIDAGITSFKIEGRMKQPSYVATVTAMYRKYTDLYLQNGRNGFKVSRKDMEVLKQAYQRRGYCDGYYYRHNGKEMISF